MTHRFETPFLPTVLGTFTNKETYLIWRAAWRGHYRALSREIRILKRLVANDHRGAHNLTNDQLAFDVVHKPRYTQVVGSERYFQGQFNLLCLQAEAREFCLMRKESKLQAGRQWAALHQKATA